MRINNLLSSFRRAFSLTELIIVLVILGLLAAISIVGYAAVVDRSEDVAAEATAASVEREMRALMAFDAGSDLNGTEESLNNAFQAVKADLPAGVQLSTIGGTLQNDLACGEQVVVIRDSQNSGVFEPICDPTTGVVDYTQSWLTVGDGSNSGGKIEVGDPSLVVSPTSPQGLTLTPTAFGSFHTSFSAPLDDGGSPVTGYEYRYVFDGQTTWSDWVTAPGEDFVFSALGGSAAIGIEVVALNAGGASPATYRAESIPQYYPDAPTSVVVTPTGPGAFDYSFDSAVVPAGGPTDVTYSYRYEIDNSGSWSTWSADSSMTSGTFASATVGYNSINFEVRAANAAGESVVSSGSTVIPPFSPGAPSDTSIEAVGLGVKVDFSFTPASEVSGSPVLEWEYRYAATSPAEVFPKDGTWEEWAVISGPLEASGQLTIPGLDYLDVLEMQFRGVNEHGAGDVGYASTVIPDFTPSEVEFIVVAGGGGRGFDQNGSERYRKYHSWKNCVPPYNTIANSKCIWYNGISGGGGAGGFISSVQGEMSGRNTAPVPVLTPKSDAGMVYNVTVGTGGGSNGWIGTRGGNSRLFTDDASHSHTAIGGGYGGGGDCRASNSRAGSSGGSGGGGGRGVGGSWQWCAGNGTSEGAGSPGNVAGSGSGTAEQGYNADPNTGGGGGAGSAGKCEGGDPIYSAITGTARPYAAGGKASAPDTNGLYCAGTSPADYGRGAGSGGGAQNGVVIIRFEEGKSMPTITGTLTYTTSTAAGYHVVKFTSGTGTFSW